MPEQGVDVIVTQAKHKRAFIQYGGARPDKPVRYGGQDAQYLAISGVSNPEAGGVDPIWVPDPVRPNKYRLVGKSISTPDLASAEVMFREMHGAVSKALLRNCPFNLYEVTGACGRLMDFSGGWTDYVLIYSYAVTNDKDHGDRVMFDSDDAIENTLSVTLDAIYPVGPLGFGENAAPEISREVTDLVYATGKPCADCDFGDQRLYAVTTTSGSGSPGLPAEVIYSLDGGATWAQANITGIGESEATYAIDTVGNYLVVVGADAYYYAEINVKTGVPGTWTKVTTGFVVDKSPRDMFVLSEREVFFVGLGGYIYKTDDITAGVEAINAGSATTANLARVHGRNETLVATGATGVVVKSNNRGATWAVTVANPEATAIIQAIAVLDSDRYWVGTNTNRVYYTLDGGETWELLSHPEFTFGGQIMDILFPTQEVGYISYHDATPTAKLLTTWNGGANWTRNQYRILNFPTFDRGTRLAAPATDDPGWASNTIAIGGLAGDGIDGIVVIGAANKM
jgi:photosystem II stability/assembly factor-like uncharacterized protein